MQRPADVVDAWSALPRKGRGPRPRSAQRHTGPPRYAAEAPEGRPGTGACAVVTVVQEAAHGRLDALGGAGARKRSTDR